jgi:hypothetical protein
MNVRSVVELDIDAPQKQVAALFADPQNSTSWMDDLERYEPVSGTPGTPGSTYRLVPKHGTMLFTATVVARDLPNEVRLSLDAPSVAVSVCGTLSKLPNDRTRLISLEVFKFKGLRNNVFGLLAQPAIGKAHRRHMEAFKRFAERKCRDVQ